MAKKILDAVQGTAKGLHKAGVMDTKTMHEFDALCLTPVCGELLVKRRQADGTGLGSDSASGKIADL